MQEVFWQIVIYGGEITSESYKPFVGSMQKLKELVEEFSADNMMNDIDLDSIFPLQKEIETVIRH